MDIYIKKTETVSGVEKTSFEKLIDIKDEFSKASGMLLSLSWGFNGIYGHSSTSYAYIGLQVMIPKLVDVNAQFTKIEAKFILDYETEGAATMDAQLYDYTSSAVVADSEVSLPNQTWGRGASGWIDVTSCAGCSIRVGNKRVGGVGFNAVKMESGVLLLKYS